MPRLLAVLSIALVVTACAGSPAGSGPALRWRVVDSTWSAPWDPMDDSMAVYRIAISDGHRADTLADIIPPWPVVISPVAIKGLQLRRSETTRQLFTYTLKDGHLEPQPLPDDLHASFTDVAISPSGAYLAYVADSAAFPYAVVRDINTGALLLRGPVTSGCDCDVDLNHARWVSADSFEIAVVDRVSGQGWRLVAGSVATRRQRVRILNREPRWHDAAPR